MAEDPVELNRRWWDEAAVDHFERTYDLDRIRQGEDPLYAIEAAELPADLTGQRVCHLQCHIGTDSVGLARRGAEVVGVDFSPEAVARARALVAELGLADRVTFVESTVQLARDAVEGTFDLVFTTWGVVGWLPDLDEWSTVITSLLRPGGALYLAETHPYPGAGELRDAGFVETQPYGGAHALLWEEPGDYADREATREHTRTVWHCHGLGEIVTALLSAGLRLDWLHEHDAVPWDIFGAATPVGDDRLHRRPGSTLPLSFSLSATKPDTR